MTAREPDPPDLAAQRAKRDALPKYTAAWYEANHAFYELAQAEIARRRAKTQPPLSDRYVTIQEGTKR